MKKIISIDPGTTGSGICILIDQEINKGVFEENEFLFEFIIKECEGFDAIVLIEDIAPYSVKMSNDVIKTVKFIGELSYRLRSASIQFELILRWNVKKWVFEGYYDYIVGAIQKRIENRKMVVKDGGFRQPTFVFVNDRSVITAMKLRWGIQNPKPGKKNPLGLSGHAWQALGLATYYIDAGNGLDRYS